MSNIRIECRKDKADFDDTKDYSKYKKEHSIGDELIISADQYFMDTEKFFNSVKGTVEKYFDKIEKK